MCVCSIRVFGVYSNDGCIDCGRYTSGGNVTGEETSTVYAVLVEWPSNNSVLLGALSSYHVSSVEMLGLTGKMCFVVYLVLVFLTLEFVPLAFSIICCYLNLIQMIPL